MHSYSGSNGNGNGRAGEVTYAEVRRMARWLGLFTAQDLADALRVPVEVGDQFVTALTYHRLCHDTGEWVDGPNGAESVHEMHPLPPGPKEHPHQVPVEIQAARQFGMLIYDERGLPVRIRTERQMRQSMSTPGARQTHKNREAAYQRQKLAELERREAQKAKAQKAPKWKRRK